MAVLYIIEGDTLGNPNEGGNAQVLRLPPIAEQTIAITGSSAQSSAFNKSTKIIRVETDSICAISIGPNPTAATASGTGTATGTGGRMVAGDKEYFGVNPGDKIAVIATT